MSGISVTVWYVKHLRCVNTELLIQWRYLSQRINFIWTLLHSMYRQHMQTCQMVYHLKKLFRSDSRISRIDTTWDHVGSWHTDSKCRYFISHSFDWCNRIHRQTTKINHEDLWSIHQRVSTLLLLLQSIVCKYHNYNLYKY